MREDSTEKGSLVVETTTNLTLRWCGHVERLDVERTTKADMVELDVMR